MTAGTMPVICVSGGPYERGHAHGRVLRDRIGAMLDIYGPAFALSEADRTDRARHFQGVIDRFSPDLMMEMRGIADGAGLDLSWIVALNARSEIMSEAGRSVGECTALFFPQTGLLGQNWDWMEALEPLTVLLDATHPDGHRVLTVTEPGMVGKIGLSSAGIGVGLNFLFSPERLDGVPVHVLLRALLDVRSSRDVEPLLARAGSGRSGHVFVGMADGQGLSLEYTGARLLRRDAEGHDLTHTNHFLRTEIDPGAAGPNSEARLSRADALLEELPDRDIATMARILADADHADYPICRSWVPSPDLGNVPVGTVCAVIMDLPRRTLHGRLGPDPKAPWQSIVLAAPAPVR